ncbi:MAG: DNA polymerase I [Sedimentisphaerales bacterium]
MVLPVLAYRYIRYGYPFRRIPLTQGKYAIVDPDDYWHLSKHKWHANGRNGTFYAVRTVITEEGKRHLLSMHRCILKVSHNIFVDHINRNGLDNRKANIRTATRAQNSQNRAKFNNRTYSSKYKGVVWNRRQKCWQAQIQINHKLTFLGRFNDEVHAAKAYDRAAKKHHGQFAALNFQHSTHRRLRSTIINELVQLVFFLAFQLNACFLSRSPRHSTFDIHHSIFAFPASLLTARLPIRKVSAMAKTLYIIDGHAHIYAAYYAMMSPLTSPAGEPTKATYIFTTAILGLIQRQKPDMLAVAMDSKIPTFRTEIYSEYKANRPPMPDDMPKQIDRIEQILAAMNVPVLRVDGFEADDIIGTLAKKAGAEGIDTYICAKDKDMLQLLDEHTCIYDVKTGKVTNPNTMLTDMGITPQQFIDRLALQGDTSDNVPGIPDVGPKTALSWIQKYGSIENLYKHIDEIKGKRGENLRKFKDNVTLSKELVTINSNVPLKVDYSDLAVKQFNEAELSRIFTELGFNRLLAQLGLTSNLSLDARDSSLVRDTGPESRVKRYEETASVKTVAHDYQLIDTQEKFDSFVDGLKRQKLFALDTETTSIDAMRADLVGISFSWRPSKGFYLPLKAPLGSKHLEIEMVRKKLAPILADQIIKKVGQNIKYDLLVLKNTGLPVKEIYFDTMVASYCLDPARSHSLNKMAADFLNYDCIPISALIGKGKNQLTFDMVDTAAACEYAAEDADITFQLYIYLKDRLEKQPLLKKLFEEVEMPLVPVLATMEYNGVSLDTRLLRNMSGEITETLQTLTERIYENAGTVFNIDSPKQLAEILFDRLNLTPIRLGKAGRSTDAAVLEQLSDQHPIIDLLLQYRTLSKLKSTYLDKLGTLINSRTNRVHASFNQTITATGRLSSSNPNLQNIPIRTELGRKIRAAFIPAEKNYCILSMDYSQIELRLLAHFSKDEALTAAFAADRDIHRFVASQIYGCQIEEVTSEMRSRCKAVNFGIIYGQGAFGLSRSIGISQAEAKKFIEDYFARYSSIRQFMDDCIAQAKQTGYAETILHRRRQIQNLTSKNAGKRSQAERLAVNTVIQGSAADLIKIAMIAIQRKIDAEQLPVKMILQIHDELVFELPTAEIKKHALWIEREMSTAIKLDIPLKVDITHGPTWLSEK